MALSRIRQRPVTRDRWEATNRYLDLNQPLAYPPSKGDNEH
jgi:hypothetical protein